MYPHYIYWKISLGNLMAPMDAFGPGTRKKIKKGLELLQHSTYRMAIEPVTEALLDAFVPLYEQNILAKENGTVFPVKETVITAQQKGICYEMVSLYEKDVFLGAAIYSVKTEEISVAYKVFPKEISLPLPISPSYLAEYTLYERACTLQKKELFHGRDRNPYGVHSNIGLALYKMQIGCVPMVSKSPQNIFKNEEAFIPTQDTLMFLGEERNTPIHTAILYTTKNEEQAKQAYHILFTRPFLDVRIIQIP